jgi:phosphate uptake regulator
MDIRKIQVTGGSSYIVSLPKDWVVASHIKKNDPVGLLRQSDGSLLITPKISGEPVQKVKDFEVSASTDRSFLLRYLVGAYIAGYTTIRIRSLGRLPPFVRKLVREFTQMAIGQEVVDETEESITIKDLLNPAEMPFQNTIHRMYVIARGMQEDAISALRNRDTVLAEDVILRDNEVDRMHWLVARQNHLLQRDINLSRKMNLSVGAAAHYYLISRILERIGDHGTRIARNVLNLMSQNPDDEIVSLIESASSAALEILRSTMEAFYEEDIQKSNETLKRVHDLEERCKEISTRALRYEAVMAIPIGSISDSIRRIGDYSGDICENVINHLIGEEM